MHGMKRVMLLCIISYYTLNAWWARITWFSTNIGLSRGCMILDFCEAVFGLRGLRLRGLQQHYAPASVLHSPPSLAHSPTLYCKLKLKIKLCVLEEFVVCHGSRGAHVEAGWLSASVEVAWPVNMWGRWWINKLRLRVAFAGDEETRMHRGFRFDISL